MWCFLISTHVLTALLYAPVSGRKSFVRHEVGPLPDFVLRDPVLFPVDDLMVAEANQARIKPMVYVSTGRPGL